MNYEKMCKLIDGIIGNEFKHVQEFKEEDFKENDLEYKQESLKENLLYEKLTKSMTKEQKDLLDSLCTSLNNELTDLCRFYFKEGLRVGVSNLKFLTEIEFIECHL